jgi:pyruvate/2-oxoglutarate/acetoin dehydrogenase E1 component
MINLTYTNYVNVKIREFFAKYEKSVIFGQNIVSGSRISGLGSELEKIDGVVTINTTNSENSLMGLGFGLALSNVPSLFLMKQHDFALLALDQLTNTNNLIRNQDLAAPFILLFVIMDAGYEGPQASLNSLDEFASLTRSPVYYLSTLEAIEAAFKNASKPGLHIMALSQKRMKQKTEKSNVKTMEFSECILYRNASNNSVDPVAIIFYGSDPSMVENILSQVNNEKSIDLFLMSQLVAIDHNADLFNEIKKYNSFFVIDTGKSDIHFSTETALRLKEEGIKVKVFQRISNSKWSEVSEDPIEFTQEQIMEQIMRSY